MGRSFFRRWALVVAALTVPVLLVGTGASASTPRAAKLSSATLTGNGSTFQESFDTVAIGGFKQQQPAVTVHYQGVGSGQGRADFAHGLTDFGGTDAPYNPAKETPPSAPFFYFPTVVAPITVSYNLPGVKGLKLSAPTIAKIFQAQITTWDDPAIKAENPKLKLPSTKITVAHRSDGSGTTANFTNFLVKAAPGVWTLGTGSTVQWAASTQGGNGNSGVANIVKGTEGGIGYVDFADAKNSGLTFAAIKNSSGKYVAPTLAGASVAAQGAKVNPDLTFDPINASGAKAYPLTSPTWVMVMQNQSDAKKGKAIVGFLNYIYGQGQSLASSVYYAPLPKPLLKQAKAQVKKIVVPTS